MRRSEAKPTTVQWPPQDVYLFGTGYLHDPAAVLTLYITSRICFMPLDYENQFVIAAAFCSSSPARELKRARASL